MRSSYSDVNINIPNISNPIQNNVNFDGVDNMDFRTTFPLKSDKNSLQKSIDGFKNNLLVQDFFYEVDNSEDYVYGELKKQEKKDLIQYFNTYKSSFIEKISDKIDEILNKSFNFNNYASTILNDEKAEQAYSNKIKR